MPDCPVGLATGTRMEEAWRHRARHDRPATRGASLRAWRCWDTALPPALTAAARPRSTPSRRSAHPHHTMGQHAEPPAHAAPVRPVPRRQPPTCPCAPAWASARDPHAAARAGDYHDAPTQHGGVPDAGLEPGGRCGAEPGQRSGWPGVAVPGLRFLWTTPGNHAAPSNPTPGLRRRR